MRMRFEVAFPGELSPTPFTTDKPMTATEVVERYIATRPGDPESPDNFRVYEMAANNGLGPHVAPDHTLVPGNRYRIERRSTHAQAA